MRRSLRYGLRLCVVMAVLGSVSLLFAPTPQQGSPYGSALSNLTMVSEAHAATCPQQYCPGIHTQCGLRLGIFTKCKITQGGNTCTTVNC